METSVKLTRSEIGQIGEDLVVNKLRVRGYKAFNANSCGNNCKDVDIYCLDGKGSYKSIQVKTTCTDNPITGFKTKNH